MIKNLAKKLLSSKTWSKRLKGKRFIFVFHDVSNPSDKHFSKENYSTSTELFKKQISLLEEIFELVSLEDICNPEKLPSNKAYASITFDDGFLSVKENAQPFLRDKDIPFSVFVNSAAALSQQNWISNIIQQPEDYTEQLCKLSRVTHTNNPIEEIINYGKFTSSFVEGYHANNPSKIFLNQQDLQDLLSEGVTIGNHTADHLVLSRCDADILREQIEKTHKFLEEGLNHTSEYFALPFGKKTHYNNEVLKEIRHYGYNKIFTTNPDHFTREDLLDEEFLIPRIGIGENSTREILFYINRTIFKKYDL